MWQRDLKSAFRKIPLCQEHAWCSWSAWSAGGKLWLSRHLAAPFGWVLSCFSSRGFGGFLVQMLIRLLWIPCSRYVDDFLGCSKAGLVFAGGKCMDVMLGLCGLALDAKKSEDGKRNSWPLAIGCMRMWPG